MKVLGSVKRLVETRKNEEAAERPTSFLGFEGWEGEPSSSSRASGGKVGNRFWVFHFSRRRTPRRWKCENPAGSAGFSRGGGKRGKPGVGFPRFPRRRHFHGPPGSAIGTAAEVETELCIAAAAATWRRSSGVRIRCRSLPAPVVPAPPTSDPV